MKYGKKNLNKKNPYQSPILNYYKFNLLHIGLYNYFRIETDQQRWQDLNRAYQIVERYVGHHRNPHFDLIQTSIDPSTRAALWPSSKEALRRFLTSSASVLAGVMPFRTRPRTAPHRAA